MEIDLYCLISKFSPPQRLSSLPKYAQVGATKQKYRINIIDSGGTRDQNINQ